MSKVDLDNLLNKYVSQNMWKNDDDEIEPIDDVLEKVSKRFNIIRHDKVKGDGRPKREHIPFYSHENDIFSDYEAAMNLFKEGEKPEDMDIGILSKFEVPIKYDSDQMSGSILSDIFKMVGEQFVEHFNSKEIIKLERTKDQYGRMIPFISINVFNQTMMHNINYNLTRIQKIYLTNIYGRAGRKSNMTDLMVNPTLTERILLSTLNALNDSFMFIIKEAFDDFLRMSPTHYRGFSSLKVILENHKSLSKTEFEDTFNKASDFMFTLSSVLWSMCKNRMTDLSIFKRSFDKALFKELDRSTDRDSVDISEIAYCSNRVLDAIKSVVNSVDCPIDVNSDEFTVVSDISSYLDIPKHVDYVPRRILNELFGRLN